MADVQTFIGFPSPLLGAEPVRLPVLFNSENAIALPKPAGTVTSYYDWYPRAPGLAEAISTQAAAGKPELARLGIGTRVSPAYPMDAEMSGVALFAKNGAANEFLLNALGSGQMRFVFRFLAAKGSNVPDSFECDLPLARHHTKALVLVSSTTGKKSRTTFRKIGDAGPFAWWEAESDFPRIHQVRVHAHESGLRIVGDTLYSREPLPFLSRYKRDFDPGKNKEEQPLCDQMCLHLYSVSFPDMDGSTHEVVAPIPPRILKMVQVLERYSQPQARRPKFNSLDEYV